MAEAPPSALGRRLTSGKAQIRRRRSLHPGGQILKRPWRLAGSSPNSSAWDAAASNPCGRCGAGVGDVAAGPLLQLCPQRASRPKPDRDLHCRAEVSGGNMQLVPAREHFRQAACRVAATLRSRSRPPAPLPGFQATHARADRGATWAAARRRSPSAPAVCAAGGAPSLAGVRAGSRRMKIPTAAQPTDMIKARSSGRPAPELRGYRITNTHPWRD